MWKIEHEIKFFRSSLGITDIDRLMYRIGESYYAFAPKGVKLSNSTIQSRNGLLGNYTEKWCRATLSDLASEMGLFAVNGVVCPEIELKSNSPADLVLCTRNATKLAPEEIKMIFEIKMGVVNNYICKSDKCDFEYFGDYKTHCGNPSLLRSDSMLKAIGKALNIRLCERSRTIPIVVLGNSPISDNYINKVDNLKNSGVIQAFLSLYPNPTTQDHVISSPQNGFCTPQTKEEFELILKNLLREKLNYFSSMKSSEEIGKIIALATQKQTDEQRGEEFLKLLYNV